MENLYCNSSGQRSDRFSNGGITARLISYLSFREFTTSAVHISTPICPEINTHAKPPSINSINLLSSARFTYVIFSRSEEHTSELQSRGHLVCRLLLEKKK